MATWDRYRNLNPTGFETQIQSGGVFVPRAYCDDPAASEIYDSKPPVCKLILDPIVQTLGSPIAWDISESMSATSTIDLFNITWGGATDIGDISNGDWFLDPLTGNVIYDAIGVYTVEAWVIDVLSEPSLHVFMDVEIVEAEPGPEAFIAAGEGGSFYYAPGLDQPWERRVSGLADVEFVDFEPDAWSFEKNNNVYDSEATIVRGGGDANDNVTANAGTLWESFTPLIPDPSNDWSDTPAPTFADCTIVKRVSDAFREDVWYYLVRALIGASYRGWIYHTINGGFSWTIYPLDGELESYPIGMDLDREDGTRLWVTTWEADEFVHLRKYIVDDTSLTLDTVYNITENIVVADVITREWGLFPFAPSGDKDLIYLYGRHSDGVDFYPIIYSTNGGTSFTLMTLGGFQVEDICASLIVGADTGGGNRKIWAVRMDYRDAV